MATLREHAGPGLVAVAYIVLAFAEGGADPQFLAAAAVAIWWAVIVGVVIRVWPGSDAPRAAVACGGCLAALCLLAGLSMIWASDAGRAFEDAVRISAYLGLFVLAVLASRRASTHAWARGVGAGLAGLAAAALLAFFQPSLFGDAATSLATEIPSAAGRLSYPVGYWNGLGACMALAVVLLGWLAARARSRPGRATASAFLALAVLALALTQSLGGVAAAIAGAVAMVAFAQGRAALAGAAVPGLAAGALLVLVASRFDALAAGPADPGYAAAGDAMLPITLALALAAAGVRWALDRRLARLRLSTPRVPRAVALALALVAIGAAGVLAAQRWDDFKDPGALAELPASGEAAPPAAQFATAAGNGRYQWWTEALDAYGSKPITGIGAGNYELYWNAHHTLPVVVADAHSLYVETLAELGPLGLLFLLGFLATAIAAGVGRRGSTRGGVAVWLGALAAGVVSAAGEWTWEIPAATAPLVVAAAALTGPATLRPRWPRPLPEAAPRTLAERFASAPSPRERFGLGVAALLAGFACIWISGVAFLTELQLAESRSAFDRADFEEAASNASYAAAIEPWAAAPRLQLAQAEEARGRYHEARTAAEEGLDRSPDDWRGFVVLARIEAHDGMRTAAEEALERANELSPVPIPVELPEPGGS